MASRQTVRIGFEGFPGPFNPDRILKLLRKRFDVELDNKTPDYLIHSVFSDRFLDYKNVIRIFYTGENVRPDFNLCDYAFGYDWLDFGDRYKRWPNYQFYDQFHEICLRRRTDQTTVPEERRFCNFIYTNRAGHPFRDEFYNLLSKYRRVESPGRHLCNSSDKIGAPYHGDWTVPKVAYQRGFKFSFAFENSSTPGYTTEKIVHALAADSIPIYWGNPDIGREFNTARIINCHDYSSPDEILHRIRTVDEDNELYRKILSQPFFPNDQIPEDLSDESILDQFERIFSQDKRAALRRNIHFWGERYERERHDAAKALQFINGKHITSIFARAMFKASKRRQD